VWSDGIEDDFFSILFSPVASTISEWRTFKLHAFQSRSFKHFKMADVETSEQGAPFEPIGGF
jgi:hypothetical protein